MKIKLLGLAAAAALIMPQAANADAVGDFYKRIFSGFSSSRLSTASRLAGWQFGIQYPACALCTCHR